MTKSEIDLGILQAIKELEELNKEAKARLNQLKQKLEAQRQKKEEVKNDRS